LLNNLKQLPIYLGTSEVDVREALMSGPAAMLMKPKNLIPTDKNSLFHLVFDWDSTLASNEGDRIVVVIIILQ